jgi:hypothetical protein
MKSIRILISVFALSAVFCFAAFAQAPHSSDKTPGQSNPTGEPASNLPQSSVTPPGPGPAASAPAPKPAPATAVPATTTTPATKNSADKEVDPYLDTPPLPEGQVTLIGGTVKSIDRIRNRLTVEPFQAKTIKMTFDERSHIYRDGVETTMMGINKGDKVYVDTQLDRTRVFARNIHVVTAAEAADARGQIVSVHGDSMTVQDDLSSQPVSFRLDPRTVVKRQGTAASQAELVPGSIVGIRFAAGRKHDLAKEVDVLAQPGNTFKFYGDVTFLDLSRGVLALHNRADDKTYELHFEPASMPPLERNSLHVGLLVSVEAQFTGKGFHAEQVKLASAEQTPQQ